ncbi:unnamed protein product [Sphagnum jensenii]|uniref:Uncharacterized protein n=1 Tax=Sphagnum jensenii TaxID=128206 RepID=A0ABP0X475_9BRYO
MLAAHAFGSPKVVIADISVEQLKVTTELGADATVLVSTDLKVKHAFETSAKGGSAIKVKFSFSACLHFVNAC